MTVIEFYRALEAHIPPSLSCTWDHDGLSICPDPDAPVRGVLVALDATEDAVDAAIRQECNIILTHHPMLFRALPSVTDHSTEGRKVMRLIRGGISTMAFHTRLDALTGGVNDILAARLGLSDIAPFGESDSADGAPIGRIGILKEPAFLDEFAHTVKTALSIPETIGGTYIEHIEPGACPVTFVGCGKPVYRVAVLGGAGEDDIAAAVSAGADTYVTGEIGYHTFSDAPYGDINLIAAGHYFTEFPVCVYLCNIAASLCPGVPVHIMGGTRTNVL